MGPLIDKANVERVDRMVEEAIAAGAKVIVRGGPVTDGCSGRCRRCRSSTPKPMLEDFVEYKHIVLRPGVAAR